MHCYYFITKNILELKKFTKEMNFRIRKFLSLFDPLSPKREGPKQQPDPSKTLLHCLWLS
jgi:hypothetical protein